MAALSMMDRAADIKTVPFFWSAMFGKTLRYAGRVEIVKQKEKECTGSPGRT